MLITGLSSHWGGRLAQVLERDAGVDAIVGVSPDDPTCALERTEFVRVGSQHALLRRIVHAAEIDTVIDTRLIVDSATAAGGPRFAHETNVIGTLNILAACGGPDSPVRKFVFKSSAHYYGCERDDPSFFTEEMLRPHPPRPGARLESGIVEADVAVQGFAERNPGVTVTTLRFCNGLGPGLKTAHTALLSLPAVPGILGFDPRYQFIHEDDIVGALPPCRPERSARASTTRRPTACSRCRRSRACWASLTRRCCRLGAPRSRGAGWACSACESPTR